MAIHFQISPILRRVPVYLSLTFSVLSLGQDSQRFRVRETVMWSNGGLFGNMNKVFELDETF